MASPITPPMISAILPTGSDDVCHLILKFLRLSIYWYQWYSYVFTSTGAFTTEFRTAICTAMEDCAEDQDAS